MTTCYLATSVKYHAIPSTCFVYGPLYHFVRPLKTKMLPLSTLYFSQIPGVAALSKPSVLVTFALVLGKKLGVIVLASCCHALVATKN